MSAPKFTTLTARCVVLANNDVDTDQIIPARFLKVTDKLGLGEKLSATGVITTMAPLIPPSF